MAIRTTAADLEAAFAVYFEAIDQCLKHRCDWALLHILVSLPDVCASLEVPAGTIDERGDSAKRYRAWCSTSFGSGGALDPAERYQLRNALLHSGSSLPDKSRFASLSFVSGPEAAEVHLITNPDTTRGGKNLTVHVGRLADETRAALRSWFAAVAMDPKRSAEVDRNLSTLVREQPKVVQRAGRVPWVGGTTSST